MTVSEFSLPHATALSPKPSSFSRTHPHTSGPPHLRSQIWPRVGCGSRTWGSALRGHRSSFKTLVRRFRETLVSQAYPQGPNKLVGLLM